MPRQQEWPWPTDAEGSPACETQVPGWRWLACLRGAHRTLGWAGRLGDPEAKGEEEAQYPAGVADPGRGEGQMVINFPQM